ncbi:MAG: tail fiber domain-containing protein [Lachnospiraceae bacterium]|nr:tail fiber domain-containing protein [Lachnospiraceae bacterium]
MEDKSSETIRSELTKENVVEALGYTPSVADGTVTGVKGNAETEYRAGNVNITPADIGLGNVANERQYSASNPQLNITGNAATATALTTNAGSATQPVYFSGGKPVACTSYANASVKYATSAGSAVDQTARDSAANALNVANSKVSTGSGATLAALELVHATPFIDFHYGNSSADYTSRLIAITSGRLDCVGDFYVSGNIHNNGTLKAAGGWAINADALYVANTNNSDYVTIYAKAFVNPSSKLIKENISAMSDAEAQKILNINVVDFDYKEQFGGTKGQHGVIAEDAIHIIPSCVVIPEEYSEEEFDLEKGIQNKILSVDYSKFVPYLIKMVQMQQEKINAQQQQIGTLNAHLDAMLNSDSTHSI